MQPNRTVASNWFTGRCIKAHMFQILFSSNLINRRFRPFRGPVNGSSKRGNVYILTVSFSSLPHRPIRPPPLSSSLTETALSSISRATENSVVCCCFLHETAYKQYLNSLPQARVKSVYSWLPLLGPIESSSQTTLWVLFWKNIVCMLCYVSMAVPWRVRLRTLTEYCDNEHF